MPHWFLFYDKEPHLASENMARDEYLFNLCHKKKAGFLRIYFWQTPTFSMGVSQKIKSVINLDYIKKNNYSYIRRITGGKTVLHNNEVTYAVVSSEDIFYKDNDLYRSYLLISSFLINTLKKIGLDVYLSKGSSSKFSRSNNPCFSFPTTNEIEIGGKKIVGSAQKRDNKALLQHGSIPMFMDYEMYSKGTGSTVDLIRSNMTTLSEVSNTSKEDLIDSLIYCFQSFINNKLEDFEFEGSEIKEIAELEKKYNSNSWNFRF